MGIQLCFPHPRDRGIVTLGKESERQRGCSREVWAQVVPSGGWGGGRCQAPGRPGLPLHPGHSPWGHADLCSSISGRQASLLAQRMCCSCDLGATGRGGKGTGHPKFAAWSLPEARGGPCGSRDRSRAWPLSPSLRLWPCWVGSRSWHCKGLERPGHPGQGPPPATSW